MMMKRWTPAMRAALVMVAGTTPALAESGKVAWGYDGSIGPAAWGSLSPDYESCATGNRQSPVDLGAADVPGPTPVVTIDYRPLPLTILHNGHTVEVVVDNGSSITVDGTRFDLLQFHFHTPSEHVVDGRSYDLEAHFVHRSAAGELAVIGVLLEAGAGNPALAEVLAHTPPAQAAKRAVPGVTVDLAGLMPAPTGFWSYGGSLTTPPCSEGVRWLVQTAPSPASLADIERLAGAMGDNARPPQPLHGREVVVAPE